MPRITALSLYPVKGMRGESLETLPIYHNVGVVGDRERAFIRANFESKLATARAPNGWAEKQFFHVGMNTARMVSLDQYTDGATIAAELGLPESPGQLWTLNEYNLTDTQGPSVSLLNMETFRFFERFLQEKGRKDAKDQMGLNPTEGLNPERFRMNIQLEGLPAFAELQLADSFPGTREITLGKRRFRVDDACERCKATHANPATGEYDLKTTSLLMEFMAQYRPGYKSPHRGTTAVMGILLVPLDNGPLDLGDELQTH